MRDEKKSKVLVSRVLELPHSQDRRIVLKDIPEGKIKVRISHKSRGVRVGNQKEP